MSTPLVINEIFAFVSVDGIGEGVITRKIGGSWMPFIGADMDRARSLRVLAVQVAKEHGIKIKLVKFTNREVLEEITFNEEADT
jgi:hypothetical protein